MRLPVAILCFGLAGAAGPVLGADLTAAAYQITPAHNAVIKFGSSWGPMLKVAWTAALDGPASYPLYAGGYVYALVAASPDEIVKIDASTGAIALRLSAGSNSSVGLAYDQGKLFSVSSSGTLSAFSAAKGRLLWSEQLPGQYSFSSAPSALNGIVYVGGAGSGGTLYAADGETGKVLWTQAVANGDDSSPAVTGKGVYVSYPCQYYDFVPKTGKPIWHVSTGCDGGGGNTVVVGAGLAFVRDPVGADTIYNAATGAAAGSFSASAPPAVPSQKIAYFLDNGTLSAVGPKTARLFWEFTGDGALSTPPIVVNNWVIVASNLGYYYVLNGTTGTTAFSGSLSASMGPALGAGGGLVLVPGGNTLVALASTT